MTRHLFKLIWNRKGTNLLLIAELFVSFLVLFGVVTVGVYSLAKLRQPVGFTYENVLDVEIDARREGVEWSPEEAKLLELAGRAVKAFPEVVTAAAASPAPFTFGEWSSSYKRNGRDVKYRMAHATEELKDVLGLTVVSGRWFMAEDDAAQGFTPVVISQRLARDVFPGADPLGQNIAAEKDQEGNPETPRRVIGVLSEYRQNGELDEPTGYVFARVRWDTKERPPDHILVKVRPGTDVAFEERLVQSLSAVAKGWSFRVQPLTASRETMMRIRTVPLVVLGLVAAFLALMVALGLTGVLWQNVTARTREIGLRRAKGAAAVRIRRQVLGEISMMTTMAVALGVVLVVQVPFFGLFGFVSLPVYATSLGVSLVLLYGLALSCALYPSLLATRVPPAEALRYE